MTYHGSLRCSHLMIGAPCWLGKMFTFVSDMSGLAKSQDNSWKNDASSEVKVRFSLNCGRNNI